jgi:hypothetical protein
MLKQPRCGFHDIHLKGYMGGCLSYRKNIGHCKQQDDLSPYLEAIKSADQYEKSINYLAGMTGSGTDYTCKQRREAG